MMYFYSLSTDLFQIATIHTDVLMRKVHLPGIKKKNLSYENMKLFTIIYFS